MAPAAVSRQGLTGDILDRRSDSRLAEGPRKYPGNQSHCRVMPGRKPHYDNRSQPESRSIMGDTSRHSILIAGRDRASQPSAAPDRASVQQPRVRAALCSLSSRTPLRPCRPTRPGIAPSCSPVPSARSAASGSRRRVAGPPSCPCASRPPQLGPCRSHAGRRAGAAPVPDVPPSAGQRGAGRGCGRLGVRMERVAGRLAGGADQRRGADDVSRWRECKGARGRATSGTPGGSSPQD